MRYPIILEEQPEGGFYAHSPDIPELHTQGDTREEALEEALDGLVTSFEFYFEDEKAVPLPSKVAGEDYVNVPAKTWSKVLILNAMLEQKITRSELARRIHVKKQNINKTLDLNHETKLSTLEKAARALGKSMEISFL